MLLPQTEANHPYVLLCHDGFELYITPYYILFCLFLCNIFYLLYVRANALPGLQFYWCRQPLTCPSSSYQSHLRLILCCYVSLMYGGQWSATSAVMEKLVNPTVETSYCLQCYESKKFQLTALAGMKFAVCFWVHRQC